VQRQLQGRQAKSKVWLVCVNAWAVCLLGCECASARASACLYVCLCVHVCVCVCMCVCGWVGGWVRRQPQGRQAKSKVWLVCVNAWAVRLLGCVPLRMLERVCMCVCVCIGQ
jgi:hypothetical protein